MNSQVLANAVLGTIHCVLIAAGFSLVRRTCGFFDFSLAGVYMCGAYTAYLAANVLGWNRPMTFVAAAILAVTTACSLERFIYRPLRRRGATPGGLLIASLGIFIVLRNLFSLGFGDDTKVLFWQPLVRQDIAFWGIHITELEIVIPVLILLICAAGFLGLRLTRFDLRLKAVADDPELARSSGIDLDMTCLVASGSAGFLAGMAGLFWGYDTAISPTMGFTGLLLGTVAAIIGGTGKILGIVTGAVILVWTQNYVLWRFASEWQDAILYTAMVAFLLFKPEGLFAGSLRREEM